MNSINLNLIFISALVFLISFLRNKKIKLILITLTSIVFYYLLSGKYLALLLLTILITHFCVSTKGKNRHIYSIGAIVFLATVIFFIKIENKLSHIIIPGASFFILQAISYILDSKKESPENKPSLTNTSLYLSFFPQLILGPIENAKSLIPQFSNIRPNFSLEVIIRILLGVTKKLVIANRLQPITLAIFSNSEAHNPLILFLGSFLFLIQLYCDFSGYMDIIIGFAQLINIRLTENFNKPYLADSIANLWRRWHITLTLWLEKYIFFQLVWRLKKIHKNIVHLSILFTFFLSGLWHGLQVNYSIYGLIHGLIIIKENIAGSIFKKRIYKIIVTNITFAMTLIVFNSESPYAAYKYFRSMLNLKNIFFMNFKIQLNASSSYIIFSTILLSFYFLGFILFLENYKIKNRSTSFIILLILLFLIATYGLDIGGRYYYEKI